MVSSVQATNGRYSALSCRRYDHCVVQFGDHRGRRAVLRLGVQRASHRGSRDLLAARRMRSQKRRVAALKEQRVLAVSVEAS
ncbi:MAG: hypothetical protein JWN13_6293 [Betaproteobacteria bacterium]|jgi:hypothetical protein|nr:hypothetical protein [Betaproteobacteria bacterium]MEA3154513.1 hypothetical protein [Betaproteobacteria bacterium]